MNMSFSATTEQMRNKTKTVTRRLAWWDLKPGTMLTAIEKGQGLKKGEKVKVIGRIRIVSVLREPLCKITQHDCRREGFRTVDDFGHSAIEKLFGSILWPASRYVLPEHFIKFFCWANKCTPETIVNRIEFEHL